MALIVAMTAGPLPVAWVAGTRISCRLSPFRRAVPRAWGHGLAGGARRKERSPGQAPPTGSAERWAVFGRFPDGAVSWLLFPVPLHSVAWGRTASNYSRSGRLRSLTEPGRNAIA